MTNEPTFVLWSTNGGFFTRMATYSTDLTAAQHFNQADAFALAKIHLTPNAFGLLPIRLDDLKALRDA